MTQLKTISNNHMSLQCRCGHSKLVSVMELIGRLSPNTTIYEVAERPNAIIVGLKVQWILGCTLFVRQRVIYDGSMRSL